MIVMRPWAIAIITPISSFEVSFFISYTEITRDVRHHLQCKGCYDDSSQGTATDAECCDDSCKAADDNNHHAKAWP